jgi:hypothetical protein
VPIGLYQKEKATLEIFEKSGLPTTKSKSDQNITRSSIKITQNPAWVAKSRLFLDGWSR